MHAFEGTEDAPTLADMVEDSTEEIVESLDSGGNDAYAEGDYMSLDMYVYNQDEIEIYVNAWNLEDGNYEIDILLENADGNTEDFDSLDFSDSYYWGYSYIFRLLGRTLCYCRIRGHK